MPTACLTTPFVEAASYSNRPVCTALAQAWVAYLTAVRAGAMEEQVGAAQSAGHGAKIGGIHWLLHCCTHTLAVACLHALASA